MSEGYWFEDGRTIDEIEPGPGVVFVGVIEWSNDSGDDPDVELARTPREIERWYAERLLARGGGVSDVIEDVGQPPGADVPHSELVAWIREFRDACTDGWLTVYLREVP